MKNMKIDANGTEIRVMGDIVNEDAYISLTDIAKYKNPDNAFIVVANWMRNHSTISFLGLWEQIHNPNFKPIEFDRFKAESGDNAFTLTPQQWIKATDAIGIISKSGRYGGTYAHTDIAFEFASWISPEFKLYIIKDYQRLKKDEADRLAIGWDVKRELSKINYRIHTDAVKEFLITPTLSQQEMAYTYASEADILNMALFGKTASQWRSEKEIKGKNSNIRDFASAEELVVLINLEDTNADLIRREVPKIERLKILREKAYRQLELLKKNQDTIEALKKNLIENTEYTLTTSGLADGCAFEITFIQSFCNTLAKDDKIIVTYSATLDDGAVPKTEYKNETWLKYGDNNETNHDTTKTKTFEMPVFKYTKDGTKEKALEGAIFTLSKDQNGTDPINLVKTSAENAAEGTYRVAKTGETGVTTVTTPSSGKFTIKGLDADTYYLTETKQPAGYNKLKEPVTVVIAEDGTITVGTNKTPVDEVKVLNNTGTILPTTGGNGTSLIYFLGAVLALVSGVVLITKQRMKNS